MKIIGVDNFDTEIVSDILVCDNISEYYGKQIVKFINDTFCKDYSSYFYKLVEDDYKLYKFEP